jgi:hypothetical protein
MGILKSRALGLAVTTFGLAAVLGGSLGVAMAGTRSLSQGFNLVGGPVSSSVSAEEWVSCLPAQSWDAVYIWQAETQQWKHYFNPGKNNTPTYVNNVNAGGIGTIPRGTGVVMIMSQAVSNATVPDGPAQACD